MVRRRRSDIPLSTAADPEAAAQSLIGMPGRPRALRGLLLVALATVLVAVAIVAIPTKTHGLQPQPLGIPGKWHLVLDSKFNGSSLDTSIWRPGWFGRGVTAPVNALEDDCYNSDNVALSGKALELKVTQASSTCKGHTYPWTGALVDTDPHDGRASGGFQYTYGVVQARVYIPADGSRLADWPAVWANSQRVSPATNGEDDIFEGIAGEACYHFHDQRGAFGRCDTAVKAGWHVVASDWRKGSVTFYYDGNRVGSITSGITSAPMFLVLDNSTSMQDPIADSMRVQYVRVWQASS